MSVVELPTDHLPGNLSECGRECHAAPATPFVVARAEQLLQQRIRCRNIDISLLFDPLTETLTLRGEVNSYYQKQLAQEALRHLEPVTQVINRLSWFRSLMWLAVERQRPHQRQMENHYECLVPHRRPPVRFLVTTPRKAVCCPGDSVSVGRDGDCRDFFASPGQRFLGITGNRSLGPGRGNALDLFHAPADSPTQTWEVPHLWNGPDSGRQDVRRDANARFES